MLIHPLKSLLKNTVTLKPNEYVNVCIQLQDPNLPITKIMNTYYMYYRRCQRLTLVEQQYNDLKDEYNLLKFKNNHFKN